MRTIAATGHACALTEQEVASQPQVWARVVGEADRLTADLPKAGQPVLFVGCGTSYYVGESYARRRNTAGLGRTRAAIASEIPYNDPDDMLMVLSRSGTTSDVISVLDQHRGRTPTVGTPHGGNPHGRHRRGVRQPYRAALRPRCRARLRRRAVPGANPVRDVGAAAATRVVG